MMLTWTENDICNSARLEGAMTIHNALAIKTELMNLLDKSHSVELDLSTVSEIDAAGLQLLILAKQHQRQLQLELTLVSHSDAVLEAMELMGLLSWFNDPVVIPG